MFAPREFGCTCRNHTKTKKGEFVGDVFMVLRFKSIQAHFSILP